MAQHTTLTLVPFTWTQLTNADVTNITFQNQSTGQVYIMATTSAVAPTTVVGALRYGKNEGEKNAALTDLFPGISGADRIYAYAEANCKVLVSHA